ncbi:hypothetical protein BsWGS_26885 [Bradybaena similaris]
MVVITLLCVGATTILGLDHIAVLVQKQSSDLMVVITLLCVGATTMLGLDHIAVLVQQQSSDLMVVITLLCVGATTMLGLDHIAVLVQQQSSDLMVVITLLCVGATTIIMTEEVELLGTHAQNGEQETSLHCLQVETFTTDGSWRTIERMMAGVGKTTTELKWLAQDRFEWQKLVCVYASHRAGRVGGGGG